MQDAIKSQGKIDEYKGKLGRGEDDTDSAKDDKEDDKKDDTKKKEVGDTVTAI